MFSKHREKLCISWKCSIAPLKKYHFRDLTECLKIEWSADRLHEHTECWQVTDSKQFQNFPIYYILGADIEDKIAFNSLRTCENMCSKGFIFFPFSFLFFPPPLAFIFRAKQGTRADWWGGGGGGYELSFSSWYLAWKTAEKGLALNESQTRKIIRATLSTKRLPLYPYKHIYGTSNC